MSFTGLLCTLEVLLVYVSPPSLSPATLLRGELFLEEGTDCSAVYWMGFPSFEVVTFHWRLLLS